jgi:hypothetical protein
MAPCLPGPPAQDEPAWRWTARCAPRRSRSSRCTVGRCIPSRASLRAADLRLARLDAADLSDANLETVEGLTQAQLDRARLNSATRLPEGLIGPKMPNDEHIALLRRGAACLSCGSNSCRRCFGRESRLDAALHRLAGTPFRRRIADNSSSPSSPSCARHIRTGSLRASDCFR